MPKVTVIIPVYNTEKYLEKCLESVCNQTLSDLEIICINDCSPDNSLAVLNEYAQKDERIRVINFEENNGVSIARNRGIDEAQGEYIGFVDSDDYVDLDFYEKLYSRAKETNADVAKGNYNYSTTGVDYNLNKKIVEEKTNFAYAFASAIYKKSLLKKHDIVFPNLSDMEDPVFTFLVALKMNKIVIDDSTNINITIRKNSATSGIPSKKSIKHKFIGLEKIIDIANKNEISENSYSYVLSFWFLCTIQNSMKNIELQEFIAENTLRLFKEVKFKQQILNNIFEEMPTISKLIEKNDLETLKTISVEEISKKNFIYRLRHNLKGSLINAKGIGNNTGL